MKYDELFSDELSQCPHLIESGKLTKAFKLMYATMFKAKQDGNLKLAQKAMSALEVTRLRFGRMLMAEDIPPGLLDKLPSWICQVLNQCNEDLGIEKETNCISAALSFYLNQPIFDPFDTMQFLKTISTDFVQVSNIDDFHYGDLVTFWSRSGGSWDNKLIEVNNINPADSDFPYGLIFDHIAVRLTPDIVFHKPDPTLVSNYRLDFLESAYATTVANSGFEMTFHRIKNR